MSCSIVQGLFVFENCQNNKSILSIEWTVFKLTYSDMAIGLLYPDIFRRMDVIDIADNNNKKTVLGQQQGELDGLYGIVNWQS